MDTRTKMTAAEAVEMLRRSDPEKITPAFCEPVKILNVYEKETKRHEFTRLGGKLTEFVYSYIFDIEIDGESLNNLSGWRRDHEEKRRVWTANKIEAYIEENTPFIPFIMGLANGFRIELTRKAGA